jgi:predicted metal-dependent enzyme (double-stranded beta helix superfamily)
VVAAHGTRETRAFSSTFLAGTKLEVTVRGLRAHTVIARAQKGHAHVRSNANLGDAAVLDRTAAIELPHIGLLRDHRPIALERALVACCRQVHDQQLVDIFEAREAGAVERAYLRLEPTAIYYEAWLIRWPPGSVAPLHDHGGAHGVAHVLGGALHELRFTPGLAAPQHRDWLPGAEIDLALGTCHEVRNTAQAVAYSVHVYAPRLERMTFYDRGAAGELRPVRQERSREWQSLTRALE